VLAQRVCEGPGDVLALVGAVYLGRLRQSALRKLAAGVTTFEEVVRVTGI
jgi:type II secretory ATPase GspE/PulE/Tfp pilus assembly ATPase PilB-like protein